MSVNKAEMASESKHTVYSLLKLNKYRIKDIKYLLTEYVTSSNHKIGI